MISAANNPDLTEFETSTDNTVLSQQELANKRLAQDWHLLAKGELSSVVTVSEVNSAVESRLSEIERLVAELRDIETVFAKQTASEFGDWRKMNIQDSTNNKEFGSLITRVVRKGKTLSLQWLTISYLKGRSGGRFARSNYIPKLTKGFSYPSTTFNKAASWEKQIVYSVESRYSLIRERWNMLSAISSAINKYGNRLSGSDEQLIRDHDTD